MQTILLFLIPLVTAQLPEAALAASGQPPAASAADGAADSFTDAALLGWNGTDGSVLLALRHGDRHYSLRHLGGDGKERKSEDVRFKDGESPPEFAAAALRKWEVAATRMKELQMVRGRAALLSEDGRALFSIRYESEQVRLLLLTAPGEEELALLPAESELALHGYFPPPGGIFVLAGSYRAGQGDAKGVLLWRAVPDKGKKLSEEAVAAAWEEEARLLVESSRFGLADDLFKLAASFKVGPGISYYQALAAALRERWADASSALERMEQAGSARWNEETQRQPVLREARLRRLPINSSADYSFKASKELEGTSVWVKIKDGAGTSVAIFKPTNGNTYHRGEVFTFQIAKLLGLEQLYPVTILLSLDRQGCDKFIASLEGAKYKGMKEKNRKRLMEECRKKGTLEGAVKEWVLDFQFFQALGTGEKVKKHKVFAHLNQAQAQPSEKEKVKAKTITKYYKPDHCKQGTYLGELNLAQLARDLSDLMVIDVLNANEDRFPGANIDFRSLGKSVESSKCVFDFGPSRLFSLDNGATFKGTYSNAYVDFTKRLQPSRFNRGTFQRLAALEQFIEDPGKVPPFLAQRGISSAAELWVYLALDKGDSHPRRSQPFKLFIANLDSVLKRMRSFERNGNAWFK